MWLRCCLAVLVDRKGEVRSRQCSVVYAGAIRGSSATEDILRSDRERAEGFHRLLFPVFWFTVAFFHPLTNRFDCSIR